ncbi:FAD linked oxidase domain protein [Beutenbergia cavernae DSM 12333]|uniref:FAD linked oxidase domain protein n=1 Tax=Beutenbergia cavernae (strain ATCC BAA-8 / DSM 12333 / CCUG 43141 / JCM 11478 / NBRC 16432 / NCIMB 13614 / HKI 0122) TaxID=471853 RepID=C5C414_BEUC1|nr:FAD-binding protein [Beutenbergia cavernae]ACQ79927.1 FAD linked oxidase domain protein [Beutenbergia cavernae DSM 12333]
MSGTSTARWTEPSDTAFDRARTSLSASAWQPARTPAAIVRPTDADAVVDAVTRARHDGRRLAVRSGGHSLSWTHLVDGAVTLDLRELRSVELDAATATAWVEPGVTVLEAARALRAAGMSFPLGHAPTVGLGGYLLAGGNGWNTPVWGHGCERILAADVVLPDGTLARIDAASDPDLLRALRGAGSAFPAVVVAFRLQLVRGCPVVSRLTVAVDADRPDALGAALDDVVAASPPHVELTVYWHPGRADGEPPRALVSATAFGPDDALDAVRSAPFVTAPPDVVVVDSLAALIETVPRHGGDGMFSHHTWTDAPFRAVLPALPPLERGLSECSSVLLTTSARRADGAAPSDALYVPRGSMSVSAYAHWDPAAQGHADAIGWARRTIGALDPLSTGRYVGEADLTRGAAALSDCFPPAELEALLATTRRHDPDGVMA